MVFQRQSNLRSIKKILAQDSNKDTMYADFLDFRLAAKFFSKKLFPDSIILHVIPAYS